MLPHNLGVADRIVRLLLGLAALGVGGWLDSGWAVAGGFVGAILLVTALSGWCPLYCPLGLSTGSR